MYYTPLTLKTRLRLAHLAAVHEVESTEDFWLTYIFWEWVYWRTFLRSLRQTRRLIP